MKFFHLVLTLLCTSSVLALPDYLNRIPNGDAWVRPGSGITCEQLGHTPCEAGAPRNQFGLDFAANGRMWSKELCEKDSDGDGLTNGQELGDPCCQWTQENPTELRQTMLSHPGDAEEDGAKEADECPQTTTQPPTTSEPTTTDPSTTEPSTTAPTTSAPTETDQSTTTAPPENNEQNGEDGDNGICFPAHATVRLEDGSTKTMAELDVGDRVQVSANEYSDVFMFTHRMPYIEYEFITIRTGSVDNVEAKITLTKSHFLYVNGAITTAESVSIGDELELASGKMSPVFDVTCEKHNGLYNPQTQHGDIIVDSVRVSTYTTAIEVGPAHSLLTPLRLLYRISGWSTSAFDNGADRILAALP